MKILYIISRYTGFKINDQKILESLGRTTTINYKKWWQYLNPKIFKYVYQNDIIVIWFASSHAIPCIIANYFFNKPIYIIAGGFDVANVRNIEYGAMQKTPKKIIGRWILSKAKSIIAVSKSNKNEIMINGKIYEKKITLIYNAIKVKSYLINKKKQILTVGEINEETILRKGLDRFLAIAKEFPKIQFIHIGKWTDKKGRPCDDAIKKIRKISPLNIQFLGFVKKHILEQYYSESMIYLQLSRHEAFGLSIVEAMTFNCIPIVTNVFALPETVGTNGHIIRNKNECIKSIKKTLANNHRIKIHINPQFDIKYRKEQFRRLLIK